MFEKKIGRRIQLFRKKKKLTQEQLAEMINVSPNHLSAIERGVYGVKLDTLIRIMNILDCTADDIFADVLSCGYKIKASRLSDELKQLSAKDQSVILSLVDIMIKKENE